MPHPTDYDGEYASTSEDWSWANVSLDNLGSYIPYQDIYNTDQDMATWTSPHQHVVEHSSTAAERPEPSEAVEHQSIPQPSQSSQAASLSFRQQLTIARSLWNNLDQATKSDPKLLADEIDLLPPGGLTFASLSDHICAILRKDGYDDGYTDAFKARRRLISDVKADIKNHHMNPHKKRDQERDMEKLKLIDLLRERHYPVDSNISDLERMTRDLHRDVIHRRMRQKNKTWHDAIMYYLIYVRGIPSAAYYRRLRADYKNGSRT